MPLSNVPRVLLTVCPSVSHYSAAKKPDKYIVWAESGEANSVWAEGHKQTQVIGGDIHYYTKSENDKNVEAIQAALTDAGIAWRLISVDNVDEPEYIHHQFSFEIIA